LLKQDILDIFFTYRADKVLQAHREIHCPPMAIPFKLRNVKLLNEMMPSKNAIAPAAVSVLLAKIVPPGNRAQEMARPGRITLFGAGTISPISQANTPYPTR
jgi:hypothetical protein